MNTEEVPHSPLESIDICVSARCVGDLSPEQTNVLNAEIFADVAAMPEIRAAIAEALPKIQETLEGLIAALG